MRTPVLAAITMVTLLSGGAASAQRLGAGAPYPVPGAYPVQQPGGYPPPPMGYPQPGPVQPYPGPAQPPVAYPNGGYPNGGYQDGSYPGGGTHAGGGRWGATVDGRWYGGAQAPGGWNAYRRPMRGYRMPSYWTASSFLIGDYAGYGLSTPPRGYGWHRYYDDAVLLDGEGRVWDSRGGIDWDGGAYGGQGGSAEASGDGYAYAERGQGGYASVPPIERGGAVTTYRTGGYGYAAPGTTTTVVTIQPTETVTTTTTEYVEERTRYVAPRRVYHARHVYRPVCGCQRVVVRRPVVRRRVEQPILGS